ncbi:FAD-dependent oxidoreductase [Ochrobactrum sp. GPK 3]|uniref:FAD-dependent oxidoreductase n=1 Tax=Brucella sp. 22210 TaxID=3453892 RepID=UPI0031385B7C
MALTVAIVGAGPAGCFLAQALTKTLPECEVDLIDRLAVPYGLVRYGVAPDHQGTKSIVRQFARLFEQGNVAFFGNLTLGVDFTIDELETLYDVVVIATGLTQDRSLHIEGEDINGVIGSGELTRWWNDHPFSAGPAVLSGPNAVIIGNGNVAIDVVRLLAKTHDEFEGSDLGGHHLAGLAESGIRHISVVGRSDAAYAKFDSVMIRELGRLQNVKIRVHDPLTANNDAQAQKLLDDLRTVDGSGSDQAEKTIEFHFGWTPVQLCGANGSLTHARFTSTTGGEQMEIPCNSLIKAIGFEDSPSQSRNALIDNAEDIASGKIAGSLYACGWFRRGPTGTIPENRADAIVVANRIGDDFATGKISQGKPGRREFARHHPHAVDYQGWKLIDAAEIAAAPPARCRQKISDHVQMLSIANGQAQQV